MSASADKVQFALQNLLEESLPLLKKAIFTRDEIRDMMAAREKHEHSMLKSTYKLTDYLRAIEYEYSLERERRRRIDQNDGVGSNPLFRKQSKTDFVFLKRILRLWDRTTFKYRYRVHLWKEYMQFCVTIGSKKHFYKALTGALRFMPFEVCLWRIGVAYEVEVSRNLWKARKIFLKGLKMIPAGHKNIELAVEMLKFEVQFLRQIVDRNAILTGQTEPQMEFILPEQISNQQEEQEEKEESEEPIPIKIQNTDDYHRILWMIVEETLSRNSNPESPSLSPQSILNTFIEVLSQLQEGQQNKVIVHNLNQLSKGLQEHLTVLTGIKVEYCLAMVDEGHEHKQSNLRATLSQEYSVDNYKESLLDCLGETYQLRWKEVKAAISKFCLKPALLAELFQFIFNVDFEGVIQLLLTSKPIRLPSSTLSELITRSAQDSMSSQETSRQLRTYICTLIDRLSVQDYVKDISLLKNVVKFNATERAGKNSQLMRSITVQCRGHPQFVERCAQIVNQS